MSEQQHSVAKPDDPNSGANRVQSLLTQAWEKSRRHVAIALVGYIIVVVFSIAYVAANHASTWFGLPSNSQPFAIAFAILLAAPLVLAFVWDRLSKVTVFNFAVELVTVTAQPGDLLPSTLRGTEPEKLSESYLYSIAPGIQNAIKQEKLAELITIDLVDGTNW